MAAPSSAAASWGNFTSLLRGQNNWHTSSSCLGRGDGEMERNGWRVPWQRLVV